MIYDPGTTLDIQAGADVCSESFIMNGTYTGNGTICGQPIGITPVSTDLPTTFILYKNFPNPFNPVTKIQFDIPKSSFTKILIYDVTGRIIKMLVNEELKPGKYEVDWDASNFPSGVYFYKIEAGSFIDSKKMILIK